jgi:hypothetical protein
MAVEALHPRTIATLERLKNASWFSRVGIQDTDVVIVVPSWHEAIAHCSTLDWENLSLSMRRTHIVNVSPNDHPSVSSCGMRSSSK